MKKVVLKICEGKVTHRKRQGLKSGYGNLFCQSFLVRKFFNAEEFSEQNL